MAAPVVFLFAAAPANHLPKESTGDVSEDVDMGEEDEFSHKEFDPGAVTNGVQGLHHIVAGVGDFEQPTRKKGKKNLLKSKEPSRNSSSLHVRGLCKQELLKPSQEVKGAMIECEKEEGSEGSKDALAAALDISQCEEKWVTFRGLRDQGRGQGRKKVKPPFSVFSLLCRSQTVKANANFFPYFFKTDTPCKDA